MPLPYLKGFLAHFGSVESVAEESPPEGISASNKAVSDPLNPMQEDPVEESSKTNYHYDVILDPAKRAQWLQGNKRPKSYNLCFDPGEGDGKCHYNEATFCWKRSIRATVEQTETNPDSGEEELIGRYEIPAAVVFHAEVQYPFTGYNHTTAYLDSFYETGEGGWENWYRRVSKFSFSCNVDLSQRDSRIEPSEQPKPVWTFGEASLILCFNTKDAESNDTTEFDYPSLGHYYQGDSYDKDIGVRRITSDQSVDFRARITLFGRDTEESQMEGIEYKPF
ncbi:uncharacterized protein I206_102309 [Kwoniella pini CBS 10737]|uniref:Uncharacterized protein n=1 Tax=Kwoniella pini CBS 10737 TaxID=1296096 RepID=A0A1B9HT53_9TREE|nr:uncharacterized protein I206_07679 [Kwoniella pini CBS 10737]OCF46445.1 hypothetical protein I206_07679 [Kwoniella pini CBS 10737]